MHIRRAVARDWYLGLTQILFDELFCFFLVLDPMDSMVTLKPGHLALGEPPFGSYDFINELPI